METHIRRLRDQGHSVVFAIPAPYVKLLDLHARDHVAVSITAHGVMLVSKLISPQVNPIPQEQRA